MKEKMKKIFANYWPSLITMPLLGFITCLYFYGNAFFASGFNFFRMYLLSMSITVLIAFGCLWFRSIMLGRFVKLEDWAWRIVFSLMGYFTFTAIPFALFYWIKDKLPPDLLMPENKLYVVFIIAMVTNIFYATAYEGITYFNKWKDAISETEQLEKLTLENQFRSLQSQLNPHFLFNSFNVLSSLISESPARAERFVDELSNVYRYLLRSNEQELATVGEELRFIRSYSHLLETRHDEGITLIINVKKENYGKKLPALALQVLVENAVKHNEISPEKPLKIEIDEEGSTLFVRNNIQQKSTKPLSNQVGLTNLRQRYELLGVKGFGVRQDREVFEVALPMVG
jgi:sensor histidine kinase YesM